MTKEKFIDLCICLGCDYININLKSKYKKVENLLLFLKEDEKDISEVINNYNNEKYNCIKNIFLKNLSLLDNNKVTEYKNDINLNHYLNNCCQYPSI